MEPIKMWNKKTNSDVEVYNIDTVTKRCLIYNAAIAGQKDGDRVFKLAYDLIWDFLHKSKNVIFDAMSLLRKDRLTLIHKFKEMAHMVCVVTGNDSARAIENQYKRDRHVPEEVVLAQSKRFQEPTYDEGWDEIIFCNK